MNTSITIDPRECNACEAHQVEGIGEFCSDHDRYDIPAYERFEDEDHEEQYALDEREDLEDSIELMYEYQLDQIAGV